MKPTRLSKVIVAAVSSAVGLFFLICGTAGLVFMVAELQYEMSIADASVTAGCVAVLSPLFAVATVRLVDLLLRVAFLVLVALLALGLFGLLEQLLIGR
jgi:hypothetical protein